MSTAALLEAQSFYYYNSGTFTCWPKLESENSTHTWDPRGHKDSKKYKMEINDHCTFDLITVAGFKEGDIIVPRLDVLWGSDATCDTKVVVKNNGKTAMFNAGNNIKKFSSLIYTGTKDSVSEE